MVPRKSLVLENFSPISEPQQRLVQKSLESWLRFLNKGLGKSRILPFATPISSLKEDIEFSFLLWNRTVYIPSVWSGLKKWGQELSLWFSGWEAEILPLRQPLHFLELRGLMEVASWPIQLDALVLFSPYRPQLSPWRGGFDQWCYEI